jgi:hypothetical protein
MAPPEAVAAFQRVAVEAGHADIAWDFVKNHLDELLTGWASAYRNQFLPSIAAGFSDERRTDELVGLTKEKLPPEAMPDAENAANLIRVRARLKTNELPAIDAYVQQRVVQEAHGAVEPQASTIDEK